MTTTKKAKTKKRKAKTTTPEYTRRALKAWETRRRMRGQLSLGITETTLNS